MPPIPPPRADGLTTSTPTPLYWAEWGEGADAPLLVLHGGPGAHLDYLLPQMLRLTTHGRALFYDQRGGGRSKSDDRAPIGWRTHVEDLAAVAREREVHPLTLVGYSWGGLLALLYAIEASKSAELPPLARLVLIDPAPPTRAFRAAFEAEFARRQQGADVQAMRSELAASGLRERDMDAYRQRLFEIGVAGYFADPRKVHDLTPFRVTGRVQQQTWDSLGDYNILADLSRVRVPAILLHGRQDPIPLEGSEATASALGAELIVLDNCGHVPYVEQPDALFAAIDDFLAPVPRP